MCKLVPQTDGHANPLTTTLGFYKTARKLGVRFITGEKVIELKKIKGRLRQVITPNNIYEADTVVVAAGYESKEILGTVGIDVPMSRVLIEALVTEAEPHMFDQMLGTAEADFYGHRQSMVHSYLVVHQVMRQSIRIMELRYAAVLPLLVYAEVL